MKWCPVCGKWGDRFRAGHPTEEADEETPAGAGHVAIEAFHGDNEFCQEVDAAADEVTDDAFVRLRRAGLF